MAKKSRSSASSAQGPNSFQALASALLAASVAQKEGDDDGSASSEAPVVKPKKGFRSRHWDNIVTLTRSVDLD